MSNLIGSETGKIHFTISTMIGAIPFHLPTTPEDVARSILIQHIGMNAFYALAGTFLGLKKPRLSFINGLQLDRALAFRFMTNRGDLVKALPKAQEI